MAHSQGINPDDNAFQLLSTNKVRTFFIANREFHGARVRMNTSRISVGFNIYPPLNPACVEEITDGGWYECFFPLDGNVVGIE